VNFKPGPDPDFPYLSVTQRFRFPLPESWNGDIVAIGGNLSPGMLLSAYEHGIFPWYNEDDPLIWQSPDPRFVIYPQNLHVSASMRRVFNSKEFEISFDRDFSGVIEGCKTIYRPGQDGTWISQDIVAGYTELHRLGYVHSVEAWIKDEKGQKQLAGGLYGIRLGRMFCGESMFAKVSNASKAAFITLARRLFSDNVAFIDCQVHTNHLESLGGCEISRDEYLEMLSGLMAERKSLLGAERDAFDRRGKWS
jgi:leucyl/phenylalanyl-tRNA--protein transferase